MESLDVTCLTERLRWEANDYWLHLEADSPLEKYPAKQHARRVQGKLGAEEGLIFLPGQTARNNEDSDMPAPFRQRRYFYYMTGCEESDCSVTYDIQHDTLSLFIPRINENRVIWYGRGSTLAEAMIKYDVDEVYYADELPGFIDDWYNHHNNRGELYVLHDSQAPVLSSNDFKLPMAIDTTSLQPAMNLSRMIKDSHEIKLIRKANEISSHAHKEVLANILKFKNEAQVQGLFVDVCVSKQAKEQAYDPIAASGPNAGTLHYDANNEDLADRQLMCLDAGCEFELYASDITRTFPLSASWPSQEAESIYRLVERMQELCIKRLAPGVRYLDLHILAHHIAIDGLLALGLLHNGTKEEIYKAGTSKAFFPHGLGHHMGLEVHDVGQAELMSVRRGKAIREQAPSLYPAEYHQTVYDIKSCYAPTDPKSSHLEEGMVVTVEPGIYFSVYALQHFYLPSPVHSRYINLEVLQRYLPVGGVRIEDDILITSNGYENLTTAPKGDAMLEIIRNGKSRKHSPKHGQRPQPRKAGIEEPQLFHAPGILTETPKRMMTPIARAAIMPAEFKQGDTVDFEPSKGPSLFSNFRRAMTTDERIQHWRQGQSEIAPIKPVTPKHLPQPGTLCGGSSQDAQHVYMSLAGRNLPVENGGTMCSNCNILYEALTRLRRNMVSLKSPSIPSPRPQASMSPASRRDVTPMRQLEIRDWESIRKGTHPARLQHQGDDQRENPKCTRPSARTRSGSFRAMNESKQAMEALRHRRPSRPDERARAEQTLQDLKAQREDPHQISQRYVTPPMNEAWPLRY